ncbi:MAG TPA: 2-amino-4-hydroxy-6-hydroxymethyldihydropteridine diphosphokinase [Rudaea sp.]
MAAAYVGLGSNLDDPHAQIERALHALAKLPDSVLKGSSRLFRTAPWGVTDQPAFVNAAAMIQTNLSPHDLLRELLAIERDAGRVRGGTRWGPRVLDLDLLLYADRVIDEPGLRLPHPHLHERAFVLLPLADIAPQLIVPGHGEVARLLARIDTTGCEPLAAA